MATYEYGARGELPPVKLTWYQGLRNGNLERAGSPWANGHHLLAIRECCTDYKNHVLLPEDKFGFKGPDPFIPRSPNGHLDWVDAVKEARTMRFCYLGLLTGQPLGQCSLSGWKENPLGHERDACDQFSKSRTVRAGVSQGLEA